MYVIREASELSNEELRDVMNLLTELVEGDYYEIITSDVIEVKNGAIYVDENGPLTIEQAFMRITGLPFSEPLDQPR